MSDLSSAGSDPRKYFMNYFGPYKTLTTAPSMNGSWLIENSYVNKARGYEVVPH